MNSVVQDWVMELPLREQGVLLSAIRGCDTTEKPRVPGVGPIERHLSAYLRFLVLHPADVREVDIPGAFMRPDYPPSDSWKASEMGHLPQHYYSHLMHAFQVVGYEHPSFDIRTVCYGIYAKMVHNLHLNIETFGEFRMRLTEDRFISGKVVS